MNEEDEVVYETPGTLEERTVIAQGCVTDLGIEFPALVDTMDNRVDDAYTGWPDRLYLIAADGKVAHKSKPGPWGFDTDELETELYALFGEEAPPKETDEEDAE